MKAIDLLFDAYALKLTDTDLEIIVFSKNLGTVRFLLPLDNLAEFFGSLALAAQEIDEGNE